MNVRLPGPADRRARHALNLAAIASQRRAHAGAARACAAAGLLTRGVHNNSVADAIAEPALAGRPLGRAGLGAVGNVFSVGDVLIAAGAVVLVAAAWACGFR